MHRLSRSLSAPSSSLGLLIAHAGLRPAGQRSCASRDSPQPTTRSPLSGRSPKPSSPAQPDGGDTCGPSPASAHVSRDALTAHPQAERRDGAAVRRDKREERVEHPRLPYATTVGATATWPRSVLLVGNGRPVGLRRLPCAPQCSLKGPRSDVAAPTRSARTGPSTHPGGSRTRSTPRGSAWRRPARHPGPGRARASSAGT